VNSVDDAVAAISSGELVVIPTDTVYGLACSPYREGPVCVMSRLKGRGSNQPIALVAASLDWLFECVPELRGRAGVLARGLLPGPYTLVLPNPARRYPWLTGDRPDTIGVRVPLLEGLAADVLDAAGAVAATSANRHGDADPRRLEDVSLEIRNAVAAVVDGGKLPGMPSTVLDLTGPEARVLREGAVPGPEALARLAAALEAVAVRKTGIRSRGLPSREHP
jgi:L-threonylcarbamoyladenylate synthase